MKYYIKLKSEKFYVEINKEQDLLEEVVELLKEKKYEAKDINIIKKI